MLQPRTKDELEKEILFKLFPRKSIKLKAENGFEFLMKNGMEAFLNVDVNTPRTIMCNIESNSVELDKLDLGEGNDIKIKKIVGVLSATYFQSEEFLSLWLRSNYLGQSTEFLGNMFKFNAEFKQFILTKELHNQLKRKYFNKNTDWTVVGNKLILGKTFNNVTQLMLFYLPSFDYTGSEWLMTDKEYQYLINVMYNKLLIMEGMALLELKISGAETSANEMITEGKEELEKVIETWKDKTPLLIGRRI